MAVQLTPAELEQTVRAAMAVTCPLCGAREGMPCTYSLAIREEGADRFLRWEQVARPAHMPRVAVHTGGAVYGPTLQRLLNTCRCGADAAMRGEHTGTCPWNLPGRAH